MYYFLFFVHLIIAFLLCVVVLLQRSKGNGLAGAFGGVGAGEAMFGAQGVTTILHKATIYLAIAFMLSSMGLAIFTARRSGGGESRVGEIIQGSIPASAVPGAVPLPVDDAGVVPADDAGGVVPADDAATTGSSETEGQEETEGGN
jgi:preprotein translocase subunit SecG